MRLLHTGDWHVGRTLRGRSRHDEHEAVLANIVAIAEEESVDVVVVAGDLFDTAAPPPEAERLVYRTLLDLAGAGRHVLVVSGNHDHPRRLGAVGPLLDLGRVTVRPFVAAPADGGVARLTVSGAELQVAFLPWLSQRHAVSATALMATDADQHSQTYADRLRRVCAALCAGFGGDTVNLVVGHMTAVGGVVGGGERSAHTIFDYAVPATVFPPTASYVALGHLHRAQELAGPAPTRYAGSPLQLDFGEGQNRPSVFVVDVEPGRPVRVRDIAVAGGRPLVTVAGPVDALDEAVAAAPPDAHLRLIVRERQRAGLAETVRERFPAAVEVKVDSGEEARVGRAGLDASRSGRAPSELFANYLGDAGVDDPRLGALFAVLLEEVASEQSGESGDGGGGHAT